MNNWDEYDYGVWEFKPTLWQRIKLKFAPVYVGVDLGQKDFTVTCEFKIINGKYIITDIRSEKL